MDEEERKRLSYAWNGCNFDETIYYLFYQLVSILNSAIVYQE